MLTTLLLVACLDVAVRGSCIDVAITDSRIEPNLTLMGCLVGGELPAAAFMKQHPVDGRPLWHFGGWKCRSENGRHHRGGAA